MNTRLSTPRRETFLVSVTLPLWGHLVHRPCVLHVYGFGLFLIAYLILGGRAFGKSLTADARQVMLGRATRSRRGRDRVGRRPSHEAGSRPNILSFLERGMIVCLQHDHVPRGCRAVSALARGSLSCWPASSTPARQKPSCGSACRSYPSCFSLRCKGANSARRSPRPPGRTPSLRARTGQIPEWVERMTPMMGKRGSSNISTCATPNHRRQPILAAYRLLTTGLPKLARRNARSRSRDASRR